MVASGGNAFKGIGLKPIHLTMLGIGYRIPVEFKKLFHLQERSDGMTTKRWATSLRIALFFIVLGIGPIMTWAKDVPRMTKEELKPLLGNPEVIIIDVRSARDWKSSQEKIQGAIREDPDEKAKSWAGKYNQEKMIILYCA